MNEFRNISKVGFMKHNGGLEFRQLTEKEYEFKTEIQDYHINAGGVTHGGFIMSMLDSGMGTAAHQVIEGSAVTISLNTNFIGGSKAGDKIIGLAKIKKKNQIINFYVWTVKM